MSLVEVELPRTTVASAGDVGPFLREACRRIDRFLLRGQLAGFVPSDFEKTYRVLQGLDAANLTTGKLFCEWGSGYGVVACLAAMLDFDSCGIEIEPELVEAAQQLADDFDLPVDFICGSFIPEGGEVLEHAGDEYAWFTPDVGDTHTRLGLEPDDFNVIFAYPWPDEEKITEAVFDRFAGRGALLLTYHGGDTFRLRRKTRQRSYRR